MVVEVWSKEGDIIENLPKVREGSTKAWVNIMYVLKFQVICEYYEFQKSYPHFGMI
jgi:hypothetical protein